MNYGDLELEISSYLDGKLQAFGFEAVPLPEDEKSFKKAYDKGRATVFFSAETADSTRSTSSVSQIVMPVIGVMIESRFLRGDQGIYALAEKVKDALNGYAPQNCDPLYFTDHRFVENDKTVFQHVIEFKTETIRVANVPEETGPLFKNLVFPDL